jgi:hypothetical protein
MPTFEKCHRAQKPDQSLPRSRLCITASGPQSAELTLARDLDAASLDRGCRRGRGRPERPHPGRRRGPGVEEAGQEETVLGMRTGEGEGADGEGRGDSGGGHRKRGHGARTSAEAAARGSDKRAHGCGFLVCWGGKREGRRRRTQQRADQGLRIE